MLRIDLHMHTWLSDGQFKPEDVLAKIAAARLDVVAITDHDTPMAHDVCADLIRQSSCRVIPAVEFSARLGEREIHLLSYFPKGFPDGLRAFVARGLDDRQNRLREILRNLEARHGIVISEREIAGIVHGPCVTRTHVAQVMKQRGIVRHRAQAFEHFLDPGFGNIPPVTRTAEEALRAVNEHGGIPVWAHPEQALFDGAIDTLVRWGLRGLEVRNGRRLGEFSKHLEAAADARGLLKTGGSDWHGNAHRELGDFVVREKHCEAFLQAIG